MDNGFQLNYHAAGDHGVHHRQASPQQAYHGYRPLGPAAMDSVMQNQHSISNNSVVRPPGSPTPRHARQGSIRSLQSSPRMLQSSPRLHRIGTPTSVVGRAAYSMSPPPLFDPVMRGPQRISAIEDPALPSREISDNNIDDAYVKFILYANPGVPKDVDTTELRKVFRAPPRSDGKSFSIYTLWLLIRKLEYKELKTWSQLAIELGVEPPSAEKGQSTQKIQQYAVRLKRWMRAMHIDAFFEYCLGKPHRYYTELPSAAANASEEGRDGVPLEEDLALRALMPEWRPKRGRKKNEPDTAVEQPSAKRPHLESHHSATDYDGLGVHSAVFPGSAQPWSAYPDDIAPETWMIGSATPQGSNMQAGVHPGVFPPRSGLDFREWRRDMSPAGYPQSAVTLGNRHPETATPEPQSAITPSSSKRKANLRRRHGPAVSSAWTSKGNAGSGRQRGRPPANKSSQDEMRSALPPNEKSDDYSRSVTDPRLQDHPISQSGTPQPTFEAVQAAQVRRNKLQLQVPERQGGPVRLATPPIVVLNGSGHLRRNSSDYFRNPDREEEDGESIFVADQEQTRAAVTHEHDFSIEDVARGFATRLLRVKIIGRPVGLSMDEANMLATKAVLSICGDVTRSRARSSKVLAVKCAIILGVEKEMGLSTSHSNPTTTSSTGSAESHLSVRSSFQNADGSISRGRKPSSINTKGSYNYTISIDTTNSLNTFSSNIQLRDLIVPAQLPSSSGIEDDAAFAALREQIRTLAEVPASAIEPPTAVNGDEDGVGDGWRQRLMDVRRDEKAADERLRRLKRLVLEVVMGSE